jgi:hypothetical protein
MWVLSDYFDFRLHFLYIRQFFWDRFGYGGSGWGDNDGLSFFLGWAQFLALLITIVVMVLMVARFLKQKADGKKIKAMVAEKLVFGGGLGVLLVATLLLTTEKTSWGWEALVEWSEFIQFPWRFMGIAIVFLALLAPLGLTFLSRRWRQIMVGIMMVILLVTSSNILVKSGNYERWGWWEVGNYFTGEKYLEEASDFYTGEPDKIATTLSGVVVDYLPISFDNEWQKSEWEVMNVEEQPEIKVQRAHEKLYYFNLDESQEVEFAVANYPNWTAQVDGQEVEVKTSERGNVVVAVPLGKTQVGLKLEPTPLRWWSNIISLVSVVIIIGYGAYPSWKIKSTLSR